MQIDTGSLEKPMNLRERRVLYRFFYNSNADVANFIDRVSSFRFLSRDLGSSPQTKYVYDFFDKMIKKLNLREMIESITREWALMGNCFVFVEESYQENTSIRKKSDIADAAKRYEGWEKIIILPPDQVRVAKIPLSSEVVLEYVPDPETLRLFAQKDSRVPRSMLRLLKQNKVPLDQNPYTGSFAHLFARRVSYYDTMGVSLLERHVDTLCSKKKAPLKLELYEPVLLMFRQQLKTFVEDCLFAPVAIKKGFVREGKAVYPKIAIM